MYDNIWIFCEYNKKCAIAYIILMFVDIENVVNVTPILFFLK